ncbi:MAG TPA: hypothetical protein VIK99_09980, partial [Thermaerobacter sp.]
GWGIGTPRILTHQLRLQDGEDALSRFLGQSPDVLRFFRQAELPLAFVDADGPSVGPGEPPAGSFVYVRRHGAEGLGRGLYGRERLRPLAASLARLLPLPPRA